MIDATPKYAISIAAELVGIHPQTLRMYETRGLIRPRRTPGGRRLYSDVDVERLRGVQALTTEFGLTLAGVEYVFGIEHRARELEAHAQALQTQLVREREQHARELAAVRREGRAEIVIWQSSSQDLDRRG